MLRFQIIKFKEKFSLKFLTPKFLTHVAYWCTVMAGGGIADGSVRALNTMWAFDLGAAVPGNRTLSGIGPDIFYY